MAQSKSLLVTLLILSQLGFSIYPILLKYYSNTLDPLHFCLMRDMGATTILFLASWQLKTEFRWTPFYIPMGLLGIFLNQYLFILGLNMTGPVQAAVIQPVIPVMTIAVQVIWDGQLGKHIKGLIGPIGLVILGTWILVFVPGQFEMSHSQLIGSGLLLGNCFSMALFLVASRKYLSKEHPLNVTLGSYASGMCWMMIAITVMELFGHSKTFFSQSLTKVGETAIPLAYSIVIQSSVCYGIVSYVNKHLPSHFVTMFFPLQVLFTVTLNWMVFGDQQLSIKDGLGGGLLMMGLAWGIRFDMTRKLAKSKSGKQENLPE